jgi:protein-S-isoprenylcysteine O-methyltransferase Ste14
MRVLRQAMQVLKDFVLPGLWFIFWAVWGYEALHVKTTQQSEPALSRIVTLLLIILSYVLTLTPWLRIGPLGWHFLPDTPFWIITGVLIAAIGIGFAITARVYLGTNWSGTITIKVDHELVSKGPYALTRHPIYTGILTGLLGSAIAYGRVSGLVGFVLILIVYWRKISKEELFLTEQFGTAYTEYRRRVKALIPFIL